MRCFHGNSARPLWESAGWKSVGQRPRRSYQDLGPVEQSVRVRVPSSGIDAAELLPDGSVVVSDAKWHLRIYDPVGALRADLELPARVMSIQLGTARVIALPSYAGDAGRCSSSTSPVLMLSRGSRAMSVGCTRRAGFPGSASSRPEPTGQPGSGTKSQVGFSGRSWGRRGTSRTRRSRPMAW